LSFFFLALPQNLDKNINSFHIPYSNNLADLNNVNKDSQKILPKNFSQNIPPKKSLPKKSSQKIHIKKNPPKKILKKIHTQKILTKNSKKVPNKFQKNS
jgi:hypothetical protein